MERHKNRDMEIATGVAEAVMFLFILCLIFPSSRDLVFGSGFVAFGLLLTAVLGGFFIVLFRHLSQETDLSDESSEVLLSPQSEIRPPEPAVVPEGAVSEELVVDGRIN